jgi:hypothetical protein
MAILEHLAWISPMLNAAMAHAPSSLVVEPWIYVTGKRRTADLPALGYESESPAVSPIEKSEKSVLPVYSAVQIFQGRPDIGHILEQEVSMAIGPVSVDGKLHLPVFCVLLTRM